MKSTSLMLCVLFALVWCTFVHATSMVDGRWISTKVENRDENTGIGVGWTVLFRPDGTFLEEIDEGFGIVEVWDGTFSLDGEKLSMHRNGFRQPWEFEAKCDRESLTIARVWGGEVQYTVTFRRSDEVHPELANLPRWPKTKVEAVAILKKKMSAKELRELAATPKDQLIEKYHFGLGMYIRNGFGVWRGNKDLWDDLTHGKRTHPDDLSMMIIEALWEDLNGKDAQPVTPANADSAKPSQ